MDTLDMAATVAAIAAGVTFVVGWVTTRFGRWLGSPERKMLAAFAVSLGAVIGLDVQAAAWFLQEQLPGFDREIPVWLDYVISGLIVQGAAGLLHDGTSKPDVVSVGGTVIDTA